MILFICSFEEILKASFDNAVNMFTVCHYIKNKFNHIYNSELLYNDTIHIFKLEFV